MRKTLNDEVVKILFLEVLQFPDPAPLNLTTSTASDNDLSSSNNKVFYDQNLIRLVGPSLIHDQFGKKVNIPKNHGKTMEFRGFELLAKALNPLTEGQTPTGKKLDMFTVTTALKQYGDYVALSDLLEMTAIDNHVLEAQEKLGDQAGRTLDTVTREVINAGTNVQYAEGQVSSRVALTSAMTLTPKAIAMAVRTLKKKMLLELTGSTSVSFHRMWHSTFSRIPITRICSVIRIIPLSRTATFSTCPALSSTRHPKRRSGLMQEQDPLMCTLP